MSMMAEQSWRWISGELRHLPVPVVLALTLFIYLLFVVCRSVSVPREYSRLPRIPIVSIVRVFAGKPEGLIRLQDRLQKACDDWCERNGVNYKQPRRQIALIWILGRWGLSTWKPKHVRQIMTSLETFPKYLAVRELLPLSNKLLGMNVVMSNGNIWKKHRKIAHPAFNRRWTTDVFGQVTRVLFEELDRHLDESVNPNTWMQLLTLDVLSLAGYGESLNSLREPNSDLVTSYNAVMDQVFAKSNRLLPFLQYIPIPATTQLAASVNKFNNFIFDMINKRTKEVQMRKADKLNGDVMDEDDDNPRNRNLLTRMIEANLEDPTFTKEDLRANMVIFFIAGHDTTSNALSVSLYFMGLHKHIQRKAREEVIALMGDNIDSTLPASEFPFPSTDEQSQLKYLTYIIKESLRLYPSVTALGFRTAAKDVELEPGLTLTKGSRVQIDILRLHRDPNIWGPDALEYKPERWDDISHLSRYGDKKSGGESGAPGKIDLSENQKSMTGSIPLMPAQHNFCWMPFGAGPRICLGQGFSVMEQRVVLAMMLLRYEWEVVGDETALKGELITSESTLLHPLNIEIKFKKRH